MNPCEANCREATKRIEQREMIAALRDPSPELLDALADAVRQAHIREVHRVHEQQRSES